jgi:hypothetical protein
LVGKFLKDEIGAIGKKRYMYLHKRTLHMYEFPFASEHNTNTQPIEHNVTNICIRISRTICRIQILNVLEVREEQHASCSTEKLLSYGIYITHTGWRLEVVAKPIFDISGYSI